MQDIKLFLQTQQHLDWMLWGLAVFISDGKLENATIVVGLPGYAIEGVVAPPNLFLERVVPLSGMTPTPAFFERIGVRSGSEGELDMVMQSGLTLLQPRLHGATFPMPDLIRIPWSAVCWWSLVPSETVPEEDDADYPTPSA